MKKITTILMLLMLTCMGAKAQVYVTETGQNMLSLADMKAGVDAGDFYVSMQQHQTSTHNYINSQGKLQGSYNTDGTTAWKVEKKGSNYVLKSVATGKYISSLAGGGGTAAGFSDNIANALEFNPVQSTSTDGNIASGYATNQSIWWNIASNTANRINTNGSNNIFQNDGTGIWTCIFTYKVTVKYNIVYKCYMQGDTEPFETVTSTDVYADGETVTITEAMLPTFAGKAMTTFDNSVTINGANAEVNVTYAASTFDYTLVVNNAPDGTTITIKGENATNGTSLSFPEAVTQSDVNVTLPQTYYTYAVVIEGTTITINIEDTRWPVNFDKSTKSTNEKRYTDMVGIDNSRVTWKSQAKDFIYRDMTSQTITVAAGRTVTPYIGFRGWAMYGYLYIDYNNDGDFTDEGELVSQMTGNTWASEDTGDKAIPDFTVTSTPGTYRARFKVEWNNTDPGGHVPSMDEHGGSITDVMIQVVNMIEINYDYKFNGVSVKTENVAAQIGMPFPAPQNPPHGFSGTAPEGNVTAEDAGTTKDIALTWTLFDYADSYNNISKWYNVRMHSNQTNYLYNNNGAVAFKGSVGTNDYLWGFVGDPIEGFQMYSLTAGDGVALDNADPCKLSADGKSVKFKVASSSKGSQTWSDSYFALYVTEGSYLNYQNGAIKRWNDNDVGSTIMVKEAQPDINEYITKLDAMVWGQNLNQYRLTGELAGYAGNEAALIAMVKGDGNINERIGMALKILANAELNMPVAGFYRIKGETSQKYLSTGDFVNDGGTNKFPMTDDATGTNTIFCFDGTKLINYGDGMANGMTKSAWAWVYGPAASTVEFGDGETNGGYFIKSTDAYFFDKGLAASCADRGSSLGAQNQYRCWKLEEVTTLTVKMNVVGDKSYATFYSPVAISKVEGAKVYVVDQTKSNSVVIEEATTQAIPAGKGVMLVSDDKSASATLTIGGDADFPTGLNGVTASEQITKDTDPYNSNLFLSKKDGKIGFYKIKTTKKNNEDVYVGVTGGFKAYLSTAAGAKEGFELEFGGVTGIDNMEHGTLNMENGAVYNLQGQRVNKAQKGVFIQNGKKVVLK